MIGKSCIITMKDLIKREIEKLSGNLLEEIFDFIQFLETKRDKALFVRASQEMSGAAFAKVWDSMRMLSMTACGGRLWQRFS